MVASFIKSVRALEFEARIDDRGHLQLPPEVAQQVQEGSNVRVILLFDADENERWRQLGLERFSAAFAEEDAVYETLIDGSESR